MRIFVTGASGWIGSALVPQLIGAGHQVSGLARSDKSAAALKAAGVEVYRGTLDDLDVLKKAATETDGVIHLAFKHDIAFSGDFAGAAHADRLAVEAFGDALEGTNKPFVLASGILWMASGTVATERDIAPPMPGPVDTRRATAEIVQAFADRGIRSSVIRLSPTVHGTGDYGFISSIIGIAREKGISGYIGAGNNYWPAVHVLDAAALFRLAIEKAPAGSVLHAAADQGVKISEIAKVIGRHLELPVESISVENAPTHFTWIAHFLAIDCQASSKMTQDLLGWKIQHPGLLEDLEMGHYFGKVAA